MSLRIVLGCLLALLTLGALLSLSPTSQGAVEDWHIQTPHTVVGDEGLDGNKSFQKDPVISPNGTRIAYASREDGGAYFDIWTMDIEGNDKVQLTDNAWDEFKPEYTPDGQYLSLASRWGNSYLLASYGNLSLYPHTDEKIWDDLYDGNQYYNYSLVPSIVDGLWGSKTWQVDRGNGSVVSQIYEESDIGRLRFIELQPIVERWDSERKEWYNESIRPFPPYREWSWWERSDYRYATYNTNSSNWYKDCVDSNLNDTDNECIWGPLEAYLTPAWLDVDSYSQSEPEFGQSVTYMLAAYDNSSYLNIYKLVIPWRQDGVDAYDWPAAKLTQLTNEQVNQKDPVFNPRDGLIYYSSKEDGDNYYDLWKMDSQGNNHQQVSYEDANQLGPTFAPGYDQLYFASDEHGDYYFDIFRTSSQPGFPLTDFKKPKDMYHIDGQDGLAGPVVYLAMDESGRYQVYTGKLDGTGAIPLVSTEQIKQAILQQLQVEPQPYSITLGSPQINSRNDTVAVDVYFRYRERFYTESYYAQLIIQRPQGHTWESREYRIISSYKADTNSWSEGLWYNASRIAFDPTDNYMALSGPLGGKPNDEGKGWYNVLIYERPTGGWVEVDLDEPLYNLRQYHGGSYTDYIHHYPTWADATTLFVARAKVAELETNGYDTPYTIYKVSSSDKWRTASLEDTRIDVNGLAQLRATNEKGLKLAWTQPNLDNGPFDVRWQVMLASYSGSSWGTPVDVYPLQGSYQYRSQPAFLSGRYLLYNLNNPTGGGTPGGMIYDIKDQTRFEKPQPLTASSINGLQVSPDGTEVAFLGQRLDAGGPTGGNNGDEGGGGPSDLATGPYLWFYDLEKRQISNKNLNDADCQYCNLGQYDNFSLISVHYRTANLLILTVLIEYKELRNNTIVLVGLSSLDVYLYNRNANRLTPLMDSEYIELVSDVSGNDILYASNKDNALGEGDLWLASFTGELDLKKTRLTDKPYTQWSGIFGPDNDTIFYLSDESGDDYQHIWQLTKPANTTWRLNNQATQLTSGKTDYSSPHLMAGKNLLLYEKEEEAAEDGSTPHNVYIRDLATGEDVQITSSESSDAMPVFNAKENVSYTNYIIYVKKGNGYTSFDQLYAINFDGDGDGYTENEDVFPSDKHEHDDNDGDGIGDDADPDDDNDGVPDDDEPPAFRFNSAEWADTDGDGIGDNADAFDLDPAASVDTDNDGYPDEWNPGMSEADSTTPLILDAFPTNSNEFKDTDGDGQGDNADSDDDNDGFPDSTDDFPEDGTEWIDTDGDKVGNNADPDDDNDGVDDYGPDGQPGVVGVDDNHNGKVDDPGEQGWPGSDDDIFPESSAEYQDNDGDGIGDNADSDDDNDGVADAQDPFPLDGGEWLDTDGDDVGDNSDSDLDGDGIPNGEDAFPDDPSEWLDSDKDGYGDNEDPDADNDGVLDENDEYPTDPGRGYWNLPVMGQASSKKIKDSLKAFSPILLSLIAGPFAFLIIKRTRYGHYKRTIRKINDAKALHDFYRFDMEVAMYNWKVWWKHQMKLRQLYVEKMKELGGDPYLPAPDKDIYRPQKGDELESGLE